MKPETTANDIECLQCGGPFPCKQCMAAAEKGAFKTNTTLELLETIGRLLDSRIDTVGDVQKPKSLVETFWLNKLERLTEKTYDRI